MREHSASVDTSSAATQRAWALREPESKHQRQIVEAYLSKLTEAELIRFAPYHDDRLDSQVLAGRFERVIFADLDSLLAGVWKGYFHLDKWFDSGISIELIDSPAPPDQLRSLLTEMYRSYSEYHRLYRKRQTIAAILLGVLTLAAMAAMIWIIPRMR